MLWRFGLFGVIHCLLLKSGLWGGSGVRFWRCFVTVFRSAFFQQFVVHFQRRVFFLFGAWRLLRFAADAAGVFACVGVGGRAVPLELSVFPHEHFDGYPCESKGQKHCGQDCYCEDVAHGVIQKKSRCVRLLCLLPLKDLNLRPPD